MTYYLSWFIQIVALVLALSALLFQSWWPLAIHAHDAARI